MNNLPALKEYSVPALPFETPGPRQKTSLLNYSNLILFSVCMMLGGVVVGLEQGRKPLFVEMRERAAQEQLDKKIALIRDALKTYAAPAEFQDFRLVENKDNVEIHFGTAVLFERGEANLSQAAEKATTELAQTLLPVTKEAHIQIEAFTDDSPMQEGAWHYPTNWELSGARAARVLRVFNKAGFNDLTFVGYGEQHPLYPNRDDKGVAIQANRLRNRRIVIRFSSL